MNAAKTSYWRQRRKESRTLHPPVRFRNRDFLSLSSICAFCFLLSAFLWAGPAEELPPLRPPKAEVPPGFWELYTWQVVAGGLAVAGLLASGAWLVTRSRPPVVASPSVQAREALQPLLSQPENGIVLSRVSQIVRNYFGALCGLPAGEMTTAEFSKAVTEAQTLEPRLRTDAVSFLRTCDERKFAPHPPAAPLDAVGQAMKLIDEAEASRALLSQKNGEPAPNQPGTDVSP